MSVNVFLDTNLWVYLYAQDGRKTQLVRQLVDAHFSDIVLSTQVIGELYHVLTRKAFCPPEQARTIAQDLLSTFPVLSVASEHVQLALDVTTRYNYSYWDSLILATALLAHCDAVYSEDMQHNQTIDTLQIVNPLS